MITLPTPTPQPVLSTMPSLDALRFGVHRIVAKRDSEGAHAAVDVLREIVAGCLAPVERELAEVNRTSRLFSDCVNRDFRDAEKVLGSPIGHLSHLTDEITKLRAQLTASTDREARLREDSDQLRIWFALSYAGSALYTDDGELQDNREHPFIDFRRDSAADLKQKLMERTARALAALHLSLETKP